MDGISAGQPASAASSGAGVGGLLADVHRRVDDFRIDQHLRRTMVALRATGWDGLTVEQCRRRRVALERLSEYRSRGEFPVNRSVPERTPLFVGDDGTPCAMAYLLLEDGRDDLVDDVMASDPMVSIEDLSEDHAVVEWIEANGLTRDEAARIQPAYPNGVQFATTCGPVPCWLAGAFVAVIGTGFFAVSEYVGYRLASDLFPDNALKRRSVLGYVTLLNLFLAPFFALVLFALFP